MVRYAITHVNNYGQRVLTFPNQGRNHYETREQAEAALTLYKPDLHQKMGIVNTLEVHAFDCYDHGDAKSIYVYAE